MSTAVAETPADVATGDKPAGKSRKKLILIVLVLVLAAGAAYWFVLRSPGDQAPKPGEVVPLDAVQVNLAKNHYLSIGIALQAVDGTKDLDGSKALDAVISLYSGKTVAELETPKKRIALKKELVHELGTLYDEEVMNVYLTQFVIQ